MLFGRAYLRLGDAAGPVDRARALLDTVIDDDAVDRALSGHARLGRTLITSADEGDRAVVQALTILLPQLGTEEVVCRALVQRV